MKYIKLFENKKTKIKNKHDIKSLKDFKISIFNLPYMFGNKIQLKIDELETYNKYNL